MRAMRRILAKVELMKPASRALASPLADLHCALFKDWLSPLT